LRFGEKKVGLKKKWPVAEKMARREDAKPSREKTRG
jgi:hypothetical protein